MFNTRKKFFLSFFSFLGLPLFLGVNCNFDPASLFPASTIEPSTPILSGRTLSEDFEENLLWSKDKIAIRNFPVPSPGLLTSENYLALVNFLGGPLDKINRLDVLDPKTGELLWQSERFPDYEAITLNNDRAFVLTNEGEHLNIYSVQSDNKPLHSFDNYFQEGTKFDLFSTSTEEVYLYYWQGDKYFVHTLNPAGEEVDFHTLEAPYPNPRLFFFDQPLSLLMAKGYTQGYSSTGEELWLVPSVGRVDSWPALEGNILVVSAGDGKNYALQAIDITMGRELWRTDKEFGSNVVAHKDHFYALRNDAVLVKFSSTTGQVEEEIAFSTSPVNAGRWAYWLASDGERLFVYFGDSQELFALQI